MRSDTSDKTTRKSDSDEPKRTQYHSVLNMHRSVLFLLVFYSIVALGLLITLMVFNDSAGRLANFGDTVADLVRTVAVFFGASSE